jgi:hypothetical protein
VVRKVQKGFFPVPKGLWKNQVAPLEAQRFAVPGWRVNVLDVRKGQVTIDAERTN